MNKLEEMLQSLLLEATSEEIKKDILSSEDQEKVFATAVELALTRASAPRLLAIIETLLTCTQSSKSKDLKFPLPRTLLTLANRVRSTNLYPPNKELMIDEYNIENFNDIKTDKIDNMGSIVCDGKYLYIYGFFGLLKIGTGYHDTIKSKVYAKNDQFYRNKHGCLILLNEPKLTLLFRSKAIEPHCFVIIDPNTLLQTNTMDFGDEYFKTIDGEHYNGEWLKSYSPSFSNGKYLSVLQKTLKKQDDDKTEQDKKNKKEGDKDTNKDDDDKNGKVYQYDIIQFDPCNNYAFTKEIKLSGPINLGSGSVGGCYGCGGNMQSEFGLGNTARKDKPYLLDWTQEIPGSFKQIAGGNQWHAYITQDGDMYCAGHNSSGQFGLGSTATIKVAKLHEFYKKKGAVKMVGSGTYADHCIVLMENGEVWSHGSGYNSQLGIGVDSAKTRPVKVKGLDGVKIVKVAADNRISVFITNKGEVYTCGYDDYGALGHGSGKRRVKIPERIEALQGIKIVDARVSYTHMMLLDDKGQVYTCGQNGYGQLGHGNKTNTKDPPKKIEWFVEQGKRVKKIVVGYYHSGCITTDGTCYMWGYASNYSLGTEKTSHEPLPVCPDFFKDKKIADLAYVTFSVSVHSVAALYKYIFMAFDRNFLFSLFCVFCVYK